MREIKSLRDNNVISPMDCYFFNNVGKAKATNVLHDWQTDSLDAPSGTNKFIEGDDFSAQVINPTTKLRNYTQHWVH